MFSWLKQKSQEQRDTEALENMLAEFRQETSHINAAWTPELRALYTGKLAEIWQGYLGVFDEKCEAHGVGTLALLPPDTRIDIGNVFAEQMIAKHKLAGKLQTKGEPTPAYLEAISAMYAYKHAGSFVTAVTTERYGFAENYAGQLDSYLAEEESDGITFTEFLEAQNAKSRR